MVQQDRHIVHFAADSELGRRTDVTGTAAVPPEKDGQLCRESPEHAALWASYDPERVKSTLDTGAGGLSAEEAECLKAAIRAARDEGSRPATRPRSIP